MVLHENNSRVFFSDQCHFGISGHSCELESNRPRFGGYFKMRNTAFVALTSAIVALGLPQGTLAADLPLKAPIYKAPTAAPVYNWTGFYVGAHIGGAWSNLTLTNDNLGVSWNPGGTGFIGGMQAGYNLQAGNFLYGIEGDFDWTTFKGATGPISTSLGLIQASASKDWMTTLAARVGITQDRWLVYGKFGGGWVQGSAALNVVNGGAIWSGSQTNSGWLAGAGIEYAFANNWTGKLEYDYLGLTNSACRSTLRPARQDPRRGIPKRWRRRRRILSRTYKPAVSEQHQFQRRAVQPHAGHTQHTARHSDAVGLRLERDLAHHRSADKPAQSGIRQQYQRNW
jgi:opacity protein-like surface antigen